MKENKRAKQKEETRKKLLEAALEVFAEKGILATKTEDITKKQNLAHGTIFLHFPTRDALLGCVIDNFGFELGRRFMELSKVSNLQELLKAHLQILKEYEPFYARLVAEGALLPPDIRNKVFIIQSGIAQFFETALSNDVQKGALRQVPLHLLVNSWLALVHYYLMHKDLFAPNTSLIDAKGQELITYFMNTLKKGT